MPLRGLPWWCALVAWLLVAVTSGTAAFFTMLYGLHYGRASSLRWLLSMAVSLVESVFVTQPLKVRTRRVLPYPPPPNPPQAEDRGEGRGSQRAAGWGGRTRAPTPGARRCWASPLSLRWS